jgi:hypothetical protein
VRNHPLNRRDRRGNYSVLLALSMTTLLGFSALAIDLSYARLVHTELQSAADTITHGAALALDGTDEGMAAAHQISAELGAANTAGGRPVIIDESTVVGSFLLGYWDDEVGEFVESDDPEEVNAAMMTVTMPGIGGWLLGGIGETSTVYSTATTVQLRGGGAGLVDCFLPVAIASCTIDDVHGIEGVQDIDFAFSPSGVDNLGWSSPFATPSASWLSRQLGNCEYSGLLGVEDRVFLNNGVLTSVLQDIVSAIERSDTTWDPEIWGALPDPYAKSSIRSSAYGRTLEGVVAIIDDDSYCAEGGGNWNGSAPISGFAWGAIYDVQATGSASNKNMRLRLDTTTHREIGLEDGGTDYGITVPDAFVLVR